MTFKARITMCVNSGTPTVWKARLTAAFHRELSGNPRWFEPDILPDTAGRELPFFSAKNAENPYETRVIPLAEKADQTGRKSGEVA
jgi:hypothetical protein